MNNKEGIQKCRAKIDLHPLLLLEKEDFIEEIVRKRLSSSIAEFFEKLMKDKDLLITQTSNDCLYKITGEVTKEFTVDFNLITTERLKELLETERNFNDLMAHWNRQNEWRNE